MSMRSSELSDFQNFGKHNWTFSPFVPLTVMPEYVGSFNGPQIVQRTQLEEMSSAVVRRVQGLQQNTTQGTYGERTHKYPFRTHDE